MTKNNAQIHEITDLHAPQMQIYTEKSEVQLLHYREPDTGIFIAESPKVIARALDAGYEPISMLVERRQLETEAKELIARCKDIPVYTADFDVLKELTGFGMVRGDALCNVPQASAAAYRALPELFPDRCVGKCGQSYQCRSNFSFGGCHAYGCGCAVARMHRSAVSKSHPRQYGNGFPDSMDRAG